MIDNFIHDVRNEMPKNPNPRRKYRTRRLSAINQLVLHCDDMDADLQTIAHYDVTPNPNHHISTQGCPEITYHYFIEKDGSIYYCADINKITWHVGNNNHNSVGICMRYKATGNIHPPTKLQAAAVKKLLVYLCLELGIDPDNIKGHRELFGTGYIIDNGIRKLRKTCPGILVNLDKLRYTVSIGVQQILKVKNYYSGRIDGLFGPKSELALQRYIKER